MQSRLRNRFRTSSTPSRSWPSKSTVVRVYLSSRANPPVTVRGQIGVRRGDGPLVMIESLNNVLVDATQSGQIAAQRNDVQRSINFLLPSDQLAAGSLTVDPLSLVDVAANSSVDPGPHSPVTLNSMRARHCACACSGSDTSKEHRLRSTFHR